MTNEPKDHAYFGRIIAERTAKLVKEYPFSCGKSQSKDRCKACLVCMGLTGDYNGSYPDPDFETWRKDGGKDYSRPTYLSTL